MNQKKRRGGNRKKKEPPPSPYKIFNEWLFNPNPNAEVPRGIFPHVNKRAVLSSLSSYGPVTVWLNSTFNNFMLSYLDDEEFYLFLKREIVNKFNLDKYSLSFFKSERTPKNIRELRMKLPLLKNEEVALFLAQLDNRIKMGGGNGTVDDKEVEECKRIAETLGLINLRKSKNPKGKGCDTALDNDSDVSMDDDEPESDADSSPSTAITNNDNDADNGVEEQQCHLSFSCFKKNFFPGSLL